MGQMFWNIWDAASYDIVKILLEENSLSNLKKIVQSGSYHPVMLNKYNSQTPCALAMQFTGMDSESLDVGGFHTPNYKSDDAILEYSPTFANKTVGEKLAWHEKNIGYKKIGLSQIPYSRNDTNCIFSINGFSKKKAPYSLFTESDFDDNGLLKCCIAEKSYEISLIKNEDRTVVVINDLNGCISKIDCDINKNNDIWLDEVSGFKVFGFTNQNGKIIVLLTDVWEYTLNNIYITEDFRTTIGPFLGVAYGRLYRNSKFGKPYYRGGDGTAEKIFYSILEQTALCFTRMNIWLMDNVDCDAVISYQPCIDEASHEFFGWWKNSTGVDKDFYWNLLKKAYKFADYHLGCVLEKMNDTDKLMLTSDHGIYEVKYNFYVNEYFKEEKLLEKNNDGEIDTSLTKVFYHPAETGALYICENSLDTKSLLARLVDLEIEGHKIFNSIEKPDSRVMGDFFLVPAHNINIKADYNEKIFEVTNKTGCHTVNTNDSSMRAICFMTDNMKNEPISSGKEISYKSISKIFIRNI